MIRVLILTRRFEYGGAERQLVELIKGLDKNVFSLTVAPFYDGGPLLREIEGIPGVEVVPLRKRGRWDVVQFFMRLWRVAASVKPHIAYGYMGVANQLALLIGWMVRGKVLWGIRASNMDLDQYDWLMKALYKIECKLSRFPMLIISNSRSAKDYHVAQGFPAEKIVVIPNGIDTNRFAADLQLREKIRSEWRVSDEEILVGLVARLDQMKDHTTFLRAAALLLPKYSLVRFVCVGDGRAAYRKKLYDLAVQLGLVDRLLWVGFRDDMVAVYSALDVACSSSSFGEGFSNVVGEAMACGVPCVVTDVGDSRWIVGDTGSAVRPNDPMAFSAALHKMLELQPALRKERGRKARERIIEHFSVGRMIKETTHLLEAANSRTARGCQSRLDAGLPQ